MQKLSREEKVAGITSREDFGLNSRLFLPATISGFKVANFYKSGQSASLSVCQSARKVDR